MLNLQITLTAPSQVEVEERSAKIRNKMTTPMKKRRTLFTSIKLLPRSQLSLKFNRERNSVPKKLKRESRKKLRSKQQRDKRRQRALSRRCKLWLMKK
jgi:hypothetical protein